MTARFAVALLVGALVLLPGFAAAEGEGTSLEELVAEMAHSRGEHTALAEHYRAKAAAARADGRRHQSMGRAYGGGKSSQRQAFQTHCKKLSEQQEAMAQEFDALAKLHDEEAQKAAP